MKSPKVTVVTVCYNEVADIERTMKSVLGQDYTELEYIVVDGASTDGTVDVISRYVDRLSRWVSEKDRGLYDAMNKGIRMATGDYILFMNAGDVFYSGDVVSRVFSHEGITEFDVVYGESVESASDGTKQFICAGTDLNVLNHIPIYRHNASFVRTSLHRKFMFDLDKIPRIGYALDFDCVYSFYKHGATFRKVDEIVVDYKKEGISGSVNRSAELAFKVTHPNCNARNIRIFKFKRKLRTALKESAIINSLMHATITAVNNVVGKYGSMFLRNFFYRKIGTSIGDGSEIGAGVKIVCPRNLVIGKYVKIGRNCSVDAGGYCEIGDGAVIADNVSIITSSHLKNHPDAPWCYMPVKIKAKARIKSGVTIMSNVIIGNDAYIGDGVTISSGSIIAANAVVTKDVPPNSLLDGNPARVIRILRT